MNMVISRATTTAAAAHPYSFTHGDFDITVHRDGFIILTADIIMPDASADERRELLPRLNGDADSAPFYSNIPLIRAGDDLILVDVGAGGNFQDTAGRLAENLKAAGVDPAEITKVVFTHVHPDHAGATVRPDGELLYPNAQYFVSEREFSFWTDRDYEAHMHPALHGFARGAQRDLSAIEDRLTLVRAGDEVVAGIVVLDAPGHTPGHIALELAGTDPLVISGDTVTNNIVFFENPQWLFGFDTDQQIAQKSRASLIDRAASEKMQLLGYHWQYPGVGRVERVGTSYRFVPR